MDCTSSSPSAISMFKCACITFGVWLHWACLQLLQTQLHIILLPIITIQTSIAPHMTPRSIILILHYINLYLPLLMILANTPTFHTSLLNQFLYIIEADPVVYVQLYIRIFVHCCTISQSKPYFRGVLVQISFLHSTSSQHLGPSTTGWHFNLAVNK